MSESLSAILKLAKNHTPLEFMKDDDTILVFTSYFITKLRILIKLGENKDCEESIDILHSNMLTAIFIILRLYNRQYEVLQVNLLADYVGRALKI